MSKMTTKTENLIMGRSSNQIFPLRKIERIFVALGFDYVTNLRARLDNWCIQFFNGEKNVIITSNETDNDVWPSLFAMLDATYNYLSTNLQCAPHIITYDFQFIQQNIKKYCFSHPFLNNTPVIYPSPLLYQPNRKEWEYKVLCVSQMYGLDLTHYGSDSNAILKALTDFTDKLENAQRYVR